MTPDPTEQPRDNAGRFQSKGLEAKASSPICVKFSIDADVALRAMGDQKSEFIRNTVEDKLRSLGML